MPEKREIARRNAARFSIGHSPLQIRGQLCRVFWTSPGGSRSKRFSNLLHQCIGHLVEPLVVPQQIVQLLLEELLGHALVVVVPTGFELAAQLVTEATSEFTQLLHRPG